MFYLQSSDRGRPTGRCCSFAAVISSMEENGAGERIILKMGVIKIYRIDSKVLYDPIRIMMPIIITVVITRKVGQKSSVDSSSSTDALLFPLMSVAWLTGTSRSSSCIGGNV